MFNQVNNTPFVVNSESVKNIIASDEMKSEVLAKFAGKRVIPAAYTDYGGSLFDMALIKYAEQENRPIVQENTWWGGKNAVMQLSEFDTSFIEDLDFSFLEDIILDIENEMALTALSSLTEDYYLNEEEREFAENWLYENCIYYPAGADFSDSDFAEALAEFKKQEVKA